MGSKSRDKSPPSIYDRFGPEPVKVPEDNELDIMEAFTTMLTISQSLATPAVPVIPPIPSVYRDPVVDWGERQKQIAKKVSADYELDNKRKKTRSSTIHSSPLLDDQYDNARPSSLLSGG